MFHDFIFGLGIITTHLTNHYPKCLYPLAPSCPLYYVFRSIVALHSFRLKLCSVKYIVHCRVSQKAPTDNILPQKLFLPDFSIHFKLKIN